MTTVYHHDWYEESDIRPWANTDDELSYAFDLQVPTAINQGGAHVYFVSYLMFRDVTTNNMFWYSFTTFDTDVFNDLDQRYERAFLDVVTNVASVHTVIGDRSTMGHPAPDSSTLQTQPWSGYKHFDFRITSYRFGNALDKLLNEYGMKASKNPADYRLVNFHFNPEISYIASGGKPQTGGLGKIGVSFKNVSIKGYKSKQNQSSTIGIFEPSKALFHLSDSNQSKTADKIFQFGPTNNDWIPFSGDWNGDEVTTIGLYDKNTANF